MEPVIRLCSFCLDSFPLEDIEHWYLNKNKYQCKLRRKEAKNKYHARNKEEENLRSRVRYSDNREVEKVKMSIWYQNNKQTRAVTMQDWRAKNKDYLQQYYKNHKQLNINYHIACNLRSRLSNAIRNEQKAGSAVEDLGCSIEALIKHLELQFEPWMNWNNYGQSGDGIWNIDHILPLNGFELSNPEQLKKACHYTNLRPLSASLNSSKKDKIIP